MPFVVSIQEEQDKAAYLKNLFEQVYFRDILERYDIRRKDILDSLVNFLASSVGSLTNPQKIYDTFKSNGEKELSLNTISSYLSYLEDAFIVNMAERYDIKGRKYISTPQKYYFTDLGLRNARLNFRQQEETHLMENALYNELDIMSMWELSKSANKAGEKAQRWTLYAMKAATDIIFSLPFAWIRRRRRCRRANP